MLKLFWSSSVPISVSIDYFSEEKYHKNIIILQSKVIKNIKFIWVFLFLEPIMNSLQSHYINGGKSL